jgi:putative membrane protein
MTLTVRKVSMVLLLLFCFACTRMQKNNEVESKKLANELNQEKFETKSEEKDAKFIVEQVSASYEEIAVARLAIQKSHNDEVKQLADRMEKDHIVFLNGLKKIASIKNISIPADESPEILSRIEKLKNLPDAGFDKKWIEWQMTRNESAIKKLETAPRGIKDEEIIKWCDGVLPILRTHLDKLMSSHYI